MACIPFDADQRVAIRVMTEMLVGALYILLSDLNHSLTCVEL